MNASGPTPKSAARLAELLGDQLPLIDTVPDSAFELVARARELVEAIVMTDVDAETRADVAVAIGAIAERLRTRRREHALYLVRHPDGRVESLVQAGAGRLNPQAPPIEWAALPAPPPPGSEPRSVEVRARCTFTAAHSGSPSRVHGGVVAAALDEVVGVAAAAAGASGMTVVLNVTLRAGTPFGVPVDIVGRYVRSEGRKRYASGEVLVDGQVTAHADLIAVSEARS
ncbi:MAG TPA: hotdog domain-containing protein [Acidimicrobiia bacterium]|nr:hotdog domain-containing protein [Acidimicrobiia bacterium]